MEDEVLEELRREVELSIKHERQVVYIFVLIRKLFDHRGSRLRSRYKLLPLYCDWVLHIKLERKQAKLILNSLTGKETDKNYLKLISFEGLRKELTGLIKQLSLSSGIVEWYWFQFRKFLLRVLIDCPLKNPTAIIKEFCFIKTMGSMDFSGKYFINCRIFTAQGEDERGLLLGDWDEITKKEMAKVDAKFEYLMIRKRLLKIIDIKDSLVGAEKDKAEHVINQLVGRMKTYEDGFRQKQLEDWLSGHDFSA